jgi:hypothetical protein
MNSRTFCSIFQVISHLFQSLGHCRLALLGLFPEVPENSKDDKQPSTGAIGAFRHSAFWVLCRALTKLQCIGQDMPRPSWEGGRERGEKQPWRKYTQGQ